MIKNNIDVTFSEDGSIVDVISGQLLKDTPEERVRQQFINLLQVDYGYPIDLIRREIPIQQGSKIMLNKTDGSEIRADIVVYTSKKAAVELDQGNILFMVECKQPNVTEGYNQLVSYIFNTSAIGVVWTNGEGLYVYRKKANNEVGLDEIISLPRYKEKWISQTTITELKIKLRAEWSEKPIVLTTTQAASLVGCVSSSIRKGMSKDGGLRYLRAQNGVYTTKEWLIDYMAHYLKENPYRFGITV